MSITLALGRVLVGLIVMSPPGPYPAVAQAAACTHGPTLPAYAHNDYTNSHPLHDALQLGFQGVEADILLRGGELRVAHEASGSRPGRNLEALYLGPLRVIVQQCGYVLTPSLPFLLNIELKEHSRAAYDSLVALLQRYTDLLGSRLADRDSPPVVVILVGWHPQLAGTVSEGYQLWRQQRITTLSPSAATDSETLVRLVSLDYGKTIGWSGRGPVPSRAQSWLGRLRTAKRDGSGRLSRAYNVPVDPAVYQLLLEAGVDLIGTKHLLASERVLRTLGSVSPR